MVSTLYREQCSELWHAESPTLAFWLSVPRPPSNLCNISGCLFRVASGMWVPRMVLKGVLLEGRERRKKNGRKGKKENICSLLWLPVYNPSAWTAKAGGLQWVQGQPGLYIAIYSKASSHKPCFQDCLSVCVWMGQCTWMEGTGQRQMPSSSLCTLRFVCVWVFVCAPCMHSAPTRQKRVSLEL